VAERAPPVATESVPDSAPKLQAGVTASAPSTVAPRLHAGVTVAEPGVPEVNMQEGVTVSAPTVAALNVQVLVQEAPPHTPIWKVVAVGVPHTFA